MIPVPPLAEQERIVAKIEELLPLVNEYDGVEKRISALNTEFPDKLRKSILQQAVQGKLTERDPSDEPASELLKRIQTEKAKLITEGKIKRRSNYRRLQKMTAHTIFLILGYGLGWEILCSIKVVMPTRATPMSSNQTIKLFDLEM